jgi:hypothetical protein
MSDQLVLLGRVKNLEDAIDRSLLEEADRTYSPLLARAAHYAQDDLWVVAARLPDELAERFVPIEAEADGFEGGVSLGSGLRLAAVLSASSEEAATQLAETLKQMFLSLPPVAREIQVSIDQSHVNLSLAITQEQLLTRRQDTTVSAAALAPVIKPEPAKPESAKPTGPQIIRIFGLDEGPREIVLRP